MADNLARAIRHGSLDGLAPSSIGPAAPATRFIFRGPPEAARLCGGAFGCALPAEACRARHEEGRAALWLGPDEWLLLAPDAVAPDAVAPADLASQIEKAVGDVPHSLVDVSHRQVGVEVKGPGAAALINAGCPLDLDRRAFPLDMSTRTLLAKADITLWREAEEVFRIEVARSFAPYVMNFLKTAQVG